MPKVTIYSRPGCCLCDDMKQQLEEVRSELHFELQEVNIDDDPALRERYTDQVPVVAVNGQEVFKYRFNRRKFLERLSAAS